MTTAAFPGALEREDISVASVSAVASAVRQGLAAHPKRLPPWLFYDSAGSRLFDQITELPEYYLTRTERAIFSAEATAIMHQAVGSADTRLRITELGAGSADKTRLLLKAAVERQGSVVYEPVDVSATALEVARERIEQEIPGVEVAPRVLDYMQGLELDSNGEGERRLVLYIGSSIGNFEPHEAARLLTGVREGLAAGDALLLGVDLKKDEATLLAAYDDAAGVTARFNLNVLARLNRELAASFDLASFAHRAVWNEAHSRIEMHLESLCPQRVRLQAIDIELAFAAGERIHTENSYKYTPGEAEARLRVAGFEPESTWMDDRGWFSVCLGRAQ